MRYEELRKDRCIYENKAAGISVYYGVLLTTGLNIVIKELQFYTADDASEAVAEALGQTRVNSHPNVTTLYGVALSQRDDKFYVCLAIERLDTDLFQEIERRALARSLWEEKQLWNYLYQVVSALEYAQNLGLCHRDVKPQNLFLSSDLLTIKVGDFGSASQTYRTHIVSTIKGSPYFLSPVLKRAFLNSHGRADLKVHHDPYKSDVYSLGLTWLYMAKLGPSSGLAHIERLGQCAKSEIASLMYSSSFKDLLGCMLVEDESARPDFCQLKEWLWGSPVPEPPLRSSDLSTSASSPRPSQDPLLCLSSSVPVDPQSKLDCDKRPVSYQPYDFQLAMDEYPQSLRHISPHTLINSLNSVFDSAKFTYLVSNYSLLAHVEYPPSIYQPSPIDLINSLNSVFDEEKFAYLLGNYALVAHFNVLARCQNCKCNYYMSFTDEYPSVPDLLFCSETCFKDYSSHLNSGEQSIQRVNHEIEGVVQPTESMKNLQRELKTSFLQRIAENKCIVCGKHQIVNLELNACKKCIDRQEKRYSKMKHEECPQCRKKWLKETRLERLFERRQRRYITLPCKHKLCSLECLRERVQRVARCPVCQTSIDDKYLQFMKVSV